MLASEKVRRHVAVAVVVAVEGARLLLAVQRVVGDVAVQHQFLLRDVEAGGELIDRHRVQSPSRCSVEALATSRPTPTTVCIATSKRQAPCAIVAQFLAGERRAVQARAHISPPSRVMPPPAKRSCTPRWPTRPNPWLQLPVLGYSLGWAIPVRWLRLDTSINAQSNGIAVLVSTRQPEISELFRDWAPVTRHQSFCKAATRRALPALLLGSRSGQGPRARARRLRHSTGFTSWPRQPS